MFPDPTIAYAAKIESKMEDLATLKDSIINVMEEDHTLMQQVHDWLGYLPKKKQPV